MRRVARKWTLRWNLSAAARARKCHRIRARAWWPAEIPVAQVPLARRARLQRACDIGHAGPGLRSGTAPAAMPGLIEQLTSRELEVLTRRVPESSGGYER